MSILNDTKDEVIEKIKRDRADITFLSEINTNMTSVHKVMIESKVYILKFVMIYTPNEYDQTQNDYDLQRYQIMLSCGKTSVFPLIRESFLITVKAHRFGVIIEQLIEYSFSDGAKLIYASCGNEPIRTTVLFMQKLIDLYLSAKSENIIAHRDLAFENIMFDSNLKLYFIDSGSVKSSVITTTEFSQIAPTRLFYAAPEYSLDHPSDKAEVKEIYTIGLISMSFLETAMNNSFDNYPKCGIVQWINKNRYAGIIQLNIQFNPRFKSLFENHLLIDYFIGDSDNLLYRLLASMTLQSASSRIRDYRIVKNVLNKIETEINHE